MPLSPDLATWLKQQGHDAVHASDKGLYCTSDSLIIEVARKEKRVIITADLDYPQLLALSYAESPGLILFRNGNYSEYETIVYLEHALNVISDDEFSNSIIVIEKERIRKRRLPLIY